MNLINYMESINYDKVVVSKIWKIFTIINKMYKMYILIQESAFITPFKKMTINKEVFKTGLCIVCAIPATQRHILGGCQQRKCELIERHDIIVNEIYKTIIERKLDNEYDSRLKRIKLKEWFLETCKMMCSVVNDKIISEMNQKPRYIICQLWWININRSGNMPGRPCVYQTTKKKQDKYKLLFNELIKAIQTYQ